MSSPSKVASTVLLLASLILSLLTIIQAYEAQEAPFQPEPYRTPLPGYEYQRALAQQKSHNLIDSCWRRDPNWFDNRQDLADCAKGFGSGAFGGKGGAIYVVTDDSDDPTSPKPGTLRYGAIQDKPLWIIFQRNMSIKLINGLLVSSFKTIDGRGANVTIGNGGPCLTIERAMHVIIHGISIVDCMPAGIPELFQNGTSVGSSDGDAISVIGSLKIWIDHCLLARATDKLIDVTLASTGITISNNFFTEQDKVIMLGDSDHYAHDANMEVTIAFNHFGHGCVQGMPRVRFGYAHVVNNRYTKWGMYAMGGSSSPTIMSEGNHFLAPDETPLKQVTKREVMPGDHWQAWMWRSSKDVFLNGAYFVQSGSRNTIVPLNVYTTYQAFPVAKGDDVPSLTIDAGPLPCVEREIC